MNIPKKIKQSHRKFIPVAKDCQIIFVDVLEAKDISYLIVQDQNYKVYFWKVHQESLVACGSIQIGSMVNCKHVLQYTDCGCEMVLGCNDGILVYVYFRLREREKQLEGQQTRVIRIQKLADKPIRWIIKGMTEYLVFTTMSQYFKISLNSQNTQIIQPQQPQKTINIQYIQQLPETLPNKQPSFCIFIQGSKIPFLLTGNQLNKLLQQQNISQQIQKINTYYSEQIDNQINMYEIVSISSLKYKKYHKYHKDGQNYEIIQIVISQANGNINVFQIQEMDLVQKQNVRCQWYNRNLVLKYMVDVGDVVLSTDCYCQYLTVVSAQRVIFLDMMQRNRAFQSLKQKKPSQINYTKWLQSEKTLLASVLTGNPKVYLYSKQLPIKYKYQPY